MIKYNRKIMEIMKKYIQKELELIEKTKKIQ